MAASAVIQAEPDWFEELLKNRRCDYVLKSGERCWMGAVVGVIESHRQFCECHWDDLVISVETYRRFRLMLEVLQVPRTQPGVAG